MGSHGRHVAPSALRGDEFVDTVADIAPVMIRVMDSECRCTSCNRAWLGFRGRELEQELGNGWIEGVHADDRETVLAFCLEVSGAPRMTHIEFRLRHADGTYRQVVDRCAPRMAGNGTLLGFVAATTDVTERSWSEVSLSAVADNALDGIIGIDDHGRILSFNRTAEKLFGYTENEIVGCNVNVLMPEPHHSEHDRYIENYLRTGEARIIGIGREEMARRKDGSVFPVELGISEFFVDGRRNFTGVIRDITEQRLLEDQLRQAQKMEAIGQLAGGIAHDFNNILTVVGGYTELLLRSMPESDSRRPSVSAIAEAGERATGLTRQLLYFSRRAMLDLSTLDLNDVVLDAEKMFRRVIGEDITLTTVLSSQLGPVRGDAGLFGQILLNLVVNARDAMPRGGKLTIETRNIDLDALYGDSHVEVEPGRYVLLSVTDTGVGMTPEVQSRVFDPFFTTKAIGKGTGLGLSVVHGIVRQCLGHIGVYSEQDLGTTFKIYLPRTEEVASTEVRRVDPVVMESRGETVLLVEDEDTVREIARLALEEQGYIVLSANGGTNALALLDDRAFDIDLLLTDVVMPGMSGRQLAEIVQSRRPELKVLFLSGYTDDAIVRHGILQSEVAFLQKPYTPSTLLAKVRQVLDDR